MDFPCFNSKNVIRLAGNKKTRNMNPGETWNGESCVVFGV